MTSPTVSRLFVASHVIPVSLVSAEVPLQYATRFAAPVPLTPDTDGAAGAYAVPFHVSTSPDDAPAPFNRVVLSIVSVTAPEAESVSTPAPDLISVAAASVSASDH